MDLLPAVDLRHGKAVRLQQGDARRETVYAEDPLALLDRFDAARVFHVHVVDLDAAFGEPPQRELIARMAARMPIQVGGGFRDRAAIEWALDAGCARVVIGSLVARDPEAFAELAAAFPAKLVPALDVEKGEVRIAGWTEGSRRSLADLCADLHGLPCPAILVTDVERDGMMTGPNFDLTRQVAVDTGLPGLLSGGVHRLEDLETARRIPEIGGVIVGRALYEGAFSIEEAVGVTRSEQLRNGS
jgi:phosphoribosylformimino-5-aminoimidazole carboxamide ribotide isomerase